MVMMTLMTIRTMIDAKPCAVDATVQCSVRWPLNHCIPPQTNCVNDVDKGDDDGDDDDDDDPDGYDDGDADGDIGDGNGVAHNENDDNGDGADDHRSGKYDAGVDAGPIQSAI